MAAADWGLGFRDAFQELPRRRSCASKFCFLSHFKSKLHLGVVAVAWNCHMQPLEMCLQKLEFVTDRHYHSQTRNALLRICACGNCGWNCVASVYKGRAARLPKAAAISSWLLRRNAASMLSCLCGQ